MIQKKIINYIRQIPPISYIAPTAVIGLIYLYLIFFAPKHEDPIHSIFTFHKGLKACGLFGVIISFIICFIGIPAGLGICIMGFKGIISELMPGHSYKPGRWSVRQNRNLRTKTYINFVPAGFIWGWVVLIFGLIVFIGSLLSIVPFVT